MDKDQSKKIHYFSTATAYAKKVGKPRLVNPGGAHRTNEIKLDEGYIIIEKEWYEGFRK